MLSLPVELEGVTGPCPHCQNTLTAPPLAQYMAPQHYEEYPSYEQEFYAEAQNENVLEETAGWGNQQYEQPTYQDAGLVNQPMTQEWMQSPYGEPQNEIAQDYVPQQGEIPSWAQPGYDPQDPRALPPPPTAYDGGPKSVSLPVAPYPSTVAEKNGRAWLLKFGLLAGVVGVGVAAYVMTHPPKVDVAPYIPPSHVPLAQLEPTQPATPPTIAGNEPRALPPVQPLAVDPVSPGSPKETPMQSAEPPPDKPLVDLVDPPAATGGSAENVAKTPSSTDPQTEVRPAVVDTPATLPEIPVSTGAAAGREVDSNVLAEPRSALKEFLAAPNWKERLKYTQHAEKMQSQMQEYYTSHADGPVKADSIDYLTSHLTPDGKNRFHLFQVFTGEGSGFPVSVEMMDGGFKIDWRSFVEFKDLLLPKYFEKYSAEPATFHVVMRRSHYFGTDVPDQEKKICFVVEPPIAGYSNNVWVDKSNGDMLSKLGERVDWSNLSYPVVTLRWVKEKNGTAYVTIMGVVSDNWRSDSTSSDVVGMPTNK